MTRILLTLAIFAALGAATTLLAVTLAPVAAAAPIRTEDNCACGGVWPQFLGSAYGVCTWDAGPGASPRIYSTYC
jgi:hypothetical protein